MVEWRRLPDRALIRKTIAEEVHEIGFLLHGQSERGDIRINQRNLIESIREVAAAVIELHHLLQRELSAVVEVRSRECDITQRRHLEVAFTRNVIKAIQGRRGNELAGTSGNHEL